MKTEEQLIEELKILFVKNLDLQIKADAIDPDMPLFKKGLGLDSLDSLELIVLLEQHYGLTLRDETVIKSVFQSIRHIAAYILAHGK